MLPFYNKNVKKNFERFKSVKLDTNNQKTLKRFYVSVLAMRHSGPEVD